jgi:hypothetical protein
LINSQPSYQKVAHGRGLLRYSKPLESLKANDDYSSTLLINADQLKYASIALLKIKPISASTLTRLNGIATAKSAIKRMLTIPETTIPANETDFDTP